MAKKSEVVWRIWDKMSETHIPSSSSITGVYASKGSAQMALTKLIQAYEKTGFTKDESLLARFTLRPYRLTPYDDYIPPYGEY